MTSAIFRGNWQVVSGKLRRGFPFCKRMVVSVAMAAVCGFSAVAAEFTIKAGSPDWSLPSSYNEGRAPSAGDTVIIPNNASVTVSDTNLASYAAFAGLSLVKMGGKTASLEINVAEGAVRTNGCQISNGSTTLAFTGKVIKTGAGETVFTNWWNYSLVVDVHVKEGTFVPPQNYNKNGQSLHIGHVEVDKGATFVLANKSPDYTSSGECGATCVQSFSGGGDIVLRGTSSMVCYVEGGVNTTFSGWIGPYVRLRPRDGSVLNLTGLANEFTAETGGNGTLTGPTFGMANSSSSSLGKGLLDFVGYGTFRYTGDGAETTDRTIQLRGTENGVDWIDAGTNGTLTLTGKVQMQNSATYTQMQRFGLKGDGESASVFSGYFANSSRSGTNYTYHVSKDGTGTWRMKSNASSQWSGALSVLNGTLQFDSLADAGVQCALGSAEQLYDDYFGPVDPAHKVDWAWKLGAAETRGTLTYVGADGGWSTNRVAVVDVGGGKIANESSAELGVFGGIRPASTAATLTIGGSSTGYSVIGDVQGNLSLAKEDSGTWILDSGNTFSGKLEVKEGTLYVRDTTKYSWYKFVFKERQSGKSETETLYACEELGFYDQDNVRINGGLRPYTNYSAVAENRLPPGFCGFQNPGSGPGYDDRSGTFYPVEAMFDDGTPLLTVNATSTYLRRYDMSKKAYVVVDPNDPDTWSTVNMHFPFGSKVVASFDLCQISRGYNYQRNVKGFSVEASVDGRRWDVLTNVTLTSGFSGNVNSPKWAFANSDYSAGSAGTHTGGAPIAGRPASSVKALSNVSAVSVAKGARLIGENTDVEIKGLEVDGRGAGTIENCTFAQTGTIVVKNSKEATGDMLELGFVNCGSPERIANWTAVVDGKTNCKIDYRDGRLYVVRPGLVMIFR